MEMSPERIDMLVAEFQDARQDLKAVSDKQNQTEIAAAAFRGKIEGSVRVLHWFLYSSTAGVIALLGGVGALIAVVWNASASMHELQVKMSEINPVTVKMMENDVTELKQRVTNLEHPQKTR